MSENQEQEPQDSQIISDEKDKPSVKQIPNENHVRFYSNNVQMGLTPWDIQFVFGEILGKDVEKNQVAVVSLATVVMSPQHAKAFLKVFTRHFKKWEAQHGEVRIPADLEEALEDTEE